MNKDDVRKGLNRHKFVYHSLRILFGWLVALIRNFKYEYKKIEGKPALILSNHNSDFDPLLMVIGMKTHFKFVASANIMHGFVGKIIKFLAGPIPREKGASADDTVALIKQNLDAGINVAMFPEGNKSWDGSTCYISPRTAQLLKESKCSLVTYRLEGDYLRSPRWAKFSRKGPVFGKIINEYSVSQLEKMSVEEIYQVICDDLATNAFEYNEVTHGKYTSEALAEGFENLAYICPNCNKFDTIETKKHDIYCKNCGLHLKMNEECKLVTSEPFEYNNEFKWNRYQKRFLKEKKKMLEKMISEPFSNDYDCQLFEVDGENKNIISSKADIEIYGDRFEVVDKSTKKRSKFKWKTIGKMGMFRRTNLYFTIANKRYEIKKEEGLSLLKYFSLWRILNDKPLY